MLSFWTTASLAWVDVIADVDKTKYFIPIKETMKCKVNYYNDLDNWHNHI